MLLVLPVQAAKRFKPRLYSPMGRGDLLPGRNGRGESKMESKNELNEKAISYLEKGAMSGIDKRFKAGEEIPRILTS